MAGQKVVVRWSEPRPAGRSRRLPWVPLIIVVALGGLALFLTRWEAGMAASVYPGVRVGGVDVGGLTLPAAKQRLAPLVETAMHRNLTVIAGSRRWAMTPRALGLRLDLATKLRQAFALGREPGTLDRYSTQLTLITQGRDLTLVGNYDSGLLAAFVQRVAIATYQAPQAAAVSLANAQATLSAHAQNGRMLDQPAATKLLAAALADSGQSVVRLPVRLLPPPVSEAEGERELGVLETLLKSTRITMRFGGQEWKMGPRSISPLISLT
ncbi:MAG: peptidoglycan binding domain-containing protein, partial [Chloroflexota bacterium]